MRKIVLIPLAVACMVISSAASFAAKPKAPAKQVEILLPEGCHINDVSPADAKLFEMGFMVREFAKDCPVAVVANIATTIKLDTAYVFAIPLKQPAADVRWFGKAFFYASGNKIGRCWEDGTDATILEADAPVEKILPASDGILFATKNALIFCDYEHKDGHILHESKGNIVLANYYAGYIFFADGKDVFIIYENKKIKIYSDKRQIKAMAVHPDGQIFLSTDKGIFMLNNDYRRLQLSKEPAAAIEVIGDDLFLTFADGRCVMVDNCSEYQKQLPKE